MTTIPKKIDGWGAIADYIITKENDGSWRNDSESSETLSFTRWGLELAKTIGISKYSFWEYRRAGMLYNELLNTLPHEYQTPLRELSKSNAEHLNVLQKLSRVAPNALYQELCDRVLIKNNITRKELDDLWSSLRPAMDSKTARGRKKNKSFTMRINDDATVRTRVVEGLLLVALKESLSTLFKHYGNPQLVDCREQYRPYQSDLIDALVLCNNDPHGFGYEVHGICIGSAHLDKDNFGLNFQTHNPQYPCDKLWLTVTHVFGEDKASYNHYPDYLGIIDAGIDEEAIKVTSLSKRRDAKPIDNLYPYTINLLAAAYCKQS